ncbi:hypothetical protein [Paenibacillus aceris]|uniref:Uncharacterized protein n=1 Tax=Paenibacillus aceris TaxID=869555 RepID=A0ABS4I1Q6_9BACL|nr:hypothetical protein [Paenibacillus aceris]MBP1964842.1 hypothetical protein [Paenibacillus aceris]
MLKSKDFEAIGESGGSYSFVKRKKTSRKAARRAVHAGWFFDD